LTIVVAIPSSTTAAPPAPVQALARLVPVAVSGPPTFLEQRHLLLCSVLLASTAPNKLGYHARRVPNGPVRGVFFTTHAKGETDHHAARHPCRARNPRAGLHHNGAVRRRPLGGHRVSTMTNTDR